MFNMKVAALNVKINRCKTLEIKALVLIWFLLCVSLVLTRVELASVFFSFMGSFASALTLRMVTHSKNHILIRNSIGILVCVLATLLNSDARLPLGRPIHVLGGAKVESQQPEFQSLALITGYLVFDLWYTVHYHCGLKLLSLNNIWENALTLSIFVTILAKIRPVYVLVQFQTPALIWISYKICSLLWEMKRSIGNPTNVVPIPSTKTVDQSCERDTNRKACSASSETTLSESTNSFWMIHGVKFDLSDFVHRHPGGVEAIELGRGRDCTALFESYHPFTDKHWEILEKYKASEVDVKKLKADSTDPFYEAIKRRVITALEANGVNPRTERCASLGRSIYYIFICTCLAISAYYHTKV
jgi:cytochrome b involved in lipid metabolism